MRRILCLALFVSSTPVWAAPQNGQRAEPEIVVNGQRAEDSRRAWEACIARNCPPAEEIAANLVYAENLFLAGDYVAARGVTGNGVRRNKRYGETLPVAVSDLLRAHSRLSLHLGEMTSYQSSLIDMVDTLRKGLGRDDARLLSARVELADGYAKQGRIDLAEREYRAIASRSRATNNPTIEGYALFRHASVLATLARTAPEYSPRAKQLLTTLIDSAAPEHQLWASAARLHAARIARADGDTAAMDRIFADYRRRPATSQPVLLYGEAVKVNAPRAGAGIAGVGSTGSSTRLLASQAVEDQWIDVAYLIDATGTPTEIEVLRNSDRYSGSWADDVREAIATRRYAPLQVPAGSPGLFRLERYTLTAPRTEVVGSRILQRSPEKRVEMIDLSNDVAGLATTGKG